jgi:methionyl-tRNA synthetase
MIYKLEVDAGNTLEALKNFGVTNIPKTNHLFVEADNPDDACFKALEKLKDKIIANNISDEIIDFLEDDLHNEIKITKLTRVRPHA